MDALGIHSPNQDALWSGEWHGISKELGFHDKIDASNKRAYRTIRYQSWAYIPQEFVQRTAEATDQESKQGLGFLQQ